MRRRLAFILILALLLSMSPAHAFVASPAESAVATEVENRATNTLSGPYSVWNSMVGSSFARGDGSETNPYIIESGEELAFLAESVNNGNSYAGKYIDLASDIDLNSYPFTPIGKDSANFAGYFDGNGFSIYGLSINIPDNTTETRWGLFANISGSCKNLNIVEGTVTCANAIRNLRVGILAGYSNSADFENCAVSGRVEIKLAESSLYVGGMVGETLPYSTFSQCTADVTVQVTGSGQPYYSLVGGLVGQAKSQTSVSQCKTAGTITVTNVQQALVGGMVGEGTPILLDSYSTANVTATGGAFSAVGGLLGKSTSTGGKISGCYATGTVLCQVPAGSGENAYAGGLVGYLQNGTIENSYAGNSSVKCLHTSVLEAVDAQAGKLVGGGAVFSGSNNYVNSAMTLQHTYYIAAVEGCGGSPEQNGTTSTPSVEVENGTFTYGSQNPRAVVGWGVYGASASFSPWIDNGNNPVLYIERRVGYRVTYMLDGNMINLSYKEGMPKEEVVIPTPQMVGYVPDYVGWNFALDNSKEQTVTYTHVHVAEGEATCLQPQRCTICHIEMSGLGDHQFETGSSAPVPPTCEENGYTLYTCILCGEQVRGDFVPPTGHALDEHYACTLCGEQFEAPLRDYAVFVFDSETVAPIADARVQIGELAVYTDAYGAARFQLEPDTATALSIEKSGYPDYENGEFALGQMPYTYVYLQSGESGIYEAWCNGDNVLLVDSQINNLSPALTAHIVVAGRAKAPITKYELVQDGRVIATSETGSFRVKNPHFKQNVPVYARMHTSGQEGHNLFEQRLNISVVGFSFTAELDDLFPFTTGLNIDFTEGAPLLSGVSLNLPGFRKNDAIHVTAGNNKVVISYGVEKDFFDKDADTKNAAEIMKKLRDKFVQQNNPRFWPKGKAKSEVTAAGAFVLEIGKDSTVTAAYGEIHVGYELSYKWGKTFAVWVVPVYVGFKAGLQGELTITDLGYDIENSAFLIPDVDFTLQAEIAAMGGIGCSLLSAGVYGAVGGELTVGTKDLQEYFRYMLYGEMGVYVRVDLFFWKELEYRLPLMHGSIYGPNGQVFSRRSMLSLAEYQTGLRRYLEDRSDWLATSLYAAEGDAHSLLQSSSYNAIQPRIVTCGDTRMMLFLDDDGSEGYNYQHLYYSLFDAATGAWGTPRRVDDSPFADLEYDVYADEQGIFLAYTKAGDITEENEEDYTAVLSGVEVYAAHYDAEAGQFAGHTNLSCNDSYDSQPQVTGEAVLWVNNPTADALSENANNTLLLADKTADGWQTPRPLTGQGATVTSLDMGTLAGDTYIALIRDTDCDLSTETDRQVELMTTAGDVTAVSTASGTNAGARFATVDGQAAVLWYGEGNIWQLTGPEETPKALLTEPLPGLTDEFCHVQLSEDCAALLFAQNGMADEVAGSRLYAIYRTENGWGQPVPLTDSVPEQYIDAFDACALDGRLLLSYLVTEATFTDTDFDRTSFFMSSCIDATYDLAVGDAVFLESELFAGPTIDLHLPVTNLSHTPLQQVTVQVQTADGAPVYDQTLTPEGPIGSGDTGYVTLTLPKDRLDNTRAYRLFVTTPDWWDENRENNYTPLALWYTDFEVAAQQMLHGHTPQLHYAVTNNGNIAGDGHLHIYREVDGQIVTLYEEELSLGIGETHTGALPVTEDFFADPAAELGTVRVEVLPALPELYNFNNGQSLQVGGLTKSNTEPLPDGEETLLTPVVIEPYVLYDKHNGGGLSAPVSEQGWSFIGVKGLAETGYHYVESTLDLSADLLQSLEEGYHYYTLTFRRNGQTAEATLIVEVTDTTPPAPPLTAEDVTVPYTGGAVQLAQLNYQTPSKGAISTRYTTGDGWADGLPTALGTYTVELTVAEDAQNAFGPATVQFQLTVVKGTRAISTPLQFREEAGRIRFEGALPTAGAGDGTLWYGYSTQNDVSTVTEWSEHGLLPAADSPTLYYVFAKIVNGENYEDAYSPGYGVEAHIHRYRSTVIPPAVQSEGYTQHVCAACGHTYADTFLPAIPLVSGDATGDGVVTDEDVALLRRYVAAKDPATGLSPVEVCAGADANGDGVINTKDVILARRVLEGGAL